jgi:hypothetical protein
MSGAPPRTARLLTALVALALGLSALVGAPPAGADGNPGPGTGTGTGSGSVEPGEHTGTLPDGATWRVIVPEGWNGTLLLYGHGYVPSFVPGPNPNPVAPDATTQRALLGEGYALAASSYAQKGWAMGTAAQDQLDALDAAVDAIGARPTRTLAYGTSMGGLVTGQLAERARHPIDGALATCGLMHGGVGLVDYQLDGAHAIDQLLAPDQDIDLVGYADLGEAQAAASALTAAVNAGQQTPQGRARVALAAALFHLPPRPPTGAAPAPGDWDAVERAQFAWFGPTLGFVTPGRADIEAVAGGNPSGNAGVDYRRQFRRSADRRQVAALYRRAGLDLRADLDRLTATADIRPDPAARRWLARTSTVSGRLAVPVLSLHTVSDNLSPVQVERAYRLRVIWSGRRSLLRQAFVDRPGHCAFTPAELVASVHALDRRVATGRWGASASWPRLDAAAESLGLGASDIVPFRPGEFLGSRRARR